MRVSELFSMFWVSNYRTTPNILTVDLLNHLEKGGFTFARI